MSFFRNSLFVILFVLLVFITTGCGGGNSSSESTKIVEVIDEIADIDYEFVDLKRGLVEYNGNNIRVEIELNNLPDKLVFDHTNLGVSSMEYLWGIIFDIDGDGEKSINDIEVAITYAKSSGNTEAESEILEKTREDIWTVKENKGIRQLIPISNVIKQGNCFTITFSRGMHASLSNIKTNNKVIFETYHNSGMFDTCQDFMQN